MSKPAAAPTPYKRPRRVDPVKRMLRGQRGDCYEYAFNEAMAHNASDDGLRVVHGEIWPEQVREPVGHAWVERDGYAYDWQMLAVYREEPMPIDEYRATRRAHAVHVFTSKELARVALANHHFGPFDQDEMTKK